MNKLSRRSKEKLNTCHPELILIVNTAIGLSQIDFGISEGNRSIEKQQEYFNAGKSKIDGITKKGKHNYTPSLAFDIYAYVNGKASYDRCELAFIAGVLISTANKLYLEGKISHTLRWGGNWDSDGIILADQRFDDMPHFELL